MKEFVNVVEITDDYFEEFTKAYLMRSRYPVFTRVMSIMTLLLGLVFLVTHYDTWYTVMGLTSVGAPAIMGLSYITQKKRMIKLNQDRLEVMGVDFRGKSQKITVTEDSFHLTGLTGKEVDLPFTSVLDHFESNNYYILFFESRILLCLSKAGFEEGTAEEFTTFISTFPKKKYVIGIIFGICTTAIAAIDLYLISFIYLSILFM